MSVDVEFSSVFSRYTSNKTVVQTNGKTIGECLHDLARQYPEFGSLILDKNGDLSSTFDIFINGESIYPNIMAHPVNNGDKFNIVMLIHGG
jgi:hypothetical protein